MAEINQSMHLTTYVSYPYYLCLLYSCTVLFKFYYQDMSTLSIPLLLKLLSLLIFAYFFWRKLQSLRPRGNPLPGPPGLPIIGNTFQFPNKNPWKQLKAWADEYGPIYQISALGKTFIVLGSEEVCNDLLRARGDIYSDRHYIGVLRDEIHLPIIKYGGEHTPLATSLLRTRPQ